MSQWKDSALLPEDRAADLLGQMTLEEKLAQLCSDLPNNLAPAGNLPDAAALKKKHPHGLGRITQFSAMGIASSAAIIKMGNAIQRYFVEHTRLGIPVLLQSENLCGYPGAGGTSFPAPINLASTFEPGLAEQMGAIAGRESRARGIRQALSPVLDAAREPRWGRVYETFGEDPYLISQMGIHYVRGMQGTGSDRMICTAKHFLGYSETQGGLNTAPTRVGDRELYEIFASPFEAVMKEADLGAVMASYSEIDGLPCGANPKIAKGLLRETMGFDGVLVSDGGAVNMMFTSFGLAKTYEETGLIALLAGLETEMPIGGAFAKLGQYVESGRLDMAVIDRAVFRVLRSKFKVGLFERPYTDEGIVLNSGKDPAALPAALVETITEKSLILLQNRDGVLPLKRGVKAALIGPHADFIRPAMSGYTYVNFIEMMNFFRVLQQNREDPSFHGITEEINKSEQDRQGAAAVFGRILGDVSPALRSALGGNAEPLLREMGGETLREALAKRLDLSYARGCGITGEDLPGIPEAVELAKKSDLLILALGGNCGWSNATGGEGRDRSSLDLPGVQQNLLEAVAAAGKPVVLVLYGPGQFAMEKIAGLADAIVLAWLPGILGGQSLAKMLCGETYPSGKLPLTIPRRTGQIPLYYNHKAGNGYDNTSRKNRDGSLSPGGLFGGGYTDGSNSPAFCFGHGLGYTTFAITGAQVTRKEVPIGEDIEIRCKLTNTGKGDGEETVQLYQRFWDAHVTRPVKSLAAFKKIKLSPGESKEISFRLSTAQLGYYNERMEFAVEPGELCLMLGTSSMDIVWRDSVMLTGAAMPLLGKRSYSCHTAVK
jgi:beta-glucosidase